MPTATDEKLATDLTDFRLETEKRFGSIDKTLAAIETQLGFIKWVGMFFAGVLVILVTSLINVAWNAGTVVSEVRTQGRALETLTVEFKTQGTRIDKVEKRLDGIDAKLDILVRRAESKAKGE
ncbi:MAG: hypothetical protein ACLQGP_03200 [Isosphaeraceae bacterium]